jgi:hypothetical protein
MSVNTNPSQTGVLVIVYCFGVYGMPNAHGILSVCIIFRISREKIDFNAFLELFSADVVFNEEANS